MGEHHWKGNRRYAKADVYALADLIREYQLSFAVACLYRTLCEQCDYRNLVYVGSITELYELTGLSRKTVTKYLDELCDKKLIARMPAPVGSRQTLFDVSRAYWELIVPNEETPWSLAKKATKERQLGPDRAPGASPTRQMTRSTWENTTFGGSEAARREESEATSYSNQTLQEEVWSSDPGQLFDQVTQRYTQGFARQQLEGELRKLGLEPDDDWRAASSSKGLDRQVVKGFMSVIDEFRDF